MGLFLLLVGNYLIIVLGPTHLKVKGNVYKQESKIRDTKWQLSCCAER